MIRYFSCARLVDLGSSFRRLFLYRDLQIESVRSCGLVVVESSHMLLPGFHRARDRPSFILNDTAFSLDTVVAHL
jgi:hypothetical protein